MAVGIAIFLMVAMSIALQVDSKDFHQVKGKYFTAFGCCHDILTTLCAKGGDEGSYNSCRKQHETCMSRHGTCADPTLSDDSNDYYIFNGKHKLYPA